MERRPGLAREYGAQFEDSSIAATYHLRPPYVPEVFETLLEIMCGKPRHVLDLGCGTGEISFGLLDSVDHIDAVDPSNAMLEAGRSRSRGDDPRIRWVRSTAEEFTFAGPYSLIVAGESLHWMDWEIVLAGCAECLRPGAYLALVSGRELVDPPWAADLDILLPRYSTNQNYRKLDLVAELERRGLFRGAGRRRTSKVAYSQTIPEYVESIHTRNGFSRERMGLAAAAEFDAAVATLVRAYAPAGFYNGAIQSEVIWGLPLPSQHSGRRQ